MVPKDRRRFLSFFAGIDGGAVSLKLAVLDSDGHILHTDYRRHNGRVADCARSLLLPLAEQFPGLRLVCTGSTGRRLADLLHLPHINEITALARGCALVCPQVRTVIEIGGEDCKYISVADGLVQDFALNSVCAAGTGSFLDQQAERMGLDIEEFSRQAGACDTPPYIAGRCSVFAKSDMIHLQQIATPVGDIAAGLCRAVARNYKGSVVRNRPMQPGVAFLGGVSRNAGVVRAMAEEFGLESSASATPDISEESDIPATLLVPERAVQVGAVGAALIYQAGHSAERAEAPLDISLLDNAHNVAHTSCTSFHPPLGPVPADMQARHVPAQSASPVSTPPVLGAVGDNISGVYMGIDVGSISTNLAVIDAQGNLLAKRYLRTASRPIEAVRTGLDEIGREMAALGDPPVLGVGTTGSGRYMIGDFVGADVVRNEITAQAMAAAFIDPDVDTIFEIGGQDSKFIRLENGVIADFEMNKACAAGTGSFLEEQAEKLGVDIKGEFSSLALSGREPRNLGERCTVFMENSLMAELAGGASLPDVLAGLSYSIVANYMGRVVAGRKVGERIFFQGGTAFNKAVAAAFERYLGKPVTVPPNHDVTGAIGMALMARDAVVPGRASSFRGFDLAHVPYAMSSFVCKGCDNCCEINKVVIDGNDRPLFYGGRCEKYDVDTRGKKPALAGEDLFAFRDKALRAVHCAYQDWAKQNGPCKRGVMGLPLVFFLHDMLPWFSTLLWQLGFEVQVSGPTDRRIITAGAGATLSDTCFPVKAALGHVQSLLDNGVTRIFLPSFVNMAAPDSPFAASQACPLTQSFPYQVRAIHPEAEVVAPSLTTRHGGGLFTRELLAALRPYGVSRRELVRAMGAAEKAQFAYVQKLQDKGQEVLNTLDSEKSALVVMGRAYNALDRGMNLNISRKIEALGRVAIPMDFLPLSGAKGEAELHHDWPHMYWRSGQRLLQAARTVAADDRLFPVIISNFSCGPDSFILRYLDEEFADKPSLCLEIDEHSADAGAVTRVEAFLDSLHRARTADTAVSESHSRQAYIADGSSARKRTIYLPPMCDQIASLAAAFQGCGGHAEALPPTTAETMQAATPYVSGKECYPFAVTTADMLHAAQAPGFDPDRSAFAIFNGSGPCRFGQYNVAQRMIMDQAGFQNVPLYSPMQDAQFYSDLGILGRDFSKRAWKGVAAVDLLVKCLHEHRPYEAEPGMADHLYARHLSSIMEALASPDCDVKSALDRARTDFSNMARHNGHRPLIGIVGEIFVRSNVFSNQDIARRVESLGGRAWLAQIGEWIYYVGAMSRRRSRYRRAYKQIARLWVEELYQRKVEHAFADLMAPCTQTAHEPPVRDLLDKAAPYLRDTFEGEAVLSVGKAVEMAEHGVHGIINAVPFGCMPGTIAAGMLDIVGRKYGIPVITLPFDGTASQTMRLNLETFMEQSQQRALKKAR